MSSLCNPFVFVLALLVCSKKAIKRVRCRLRLLKNKRQAIARQLRNDLVELIQSGHEETAFNQVC